jgi:hypothetical protein
MCVAAEAPQHRLFIVQYPRTAPGRNGQINARPARGRCESRNGVFGKTKAVNVYSSVGRLAGFQTTSHTWPFGSRKYPA